MNKPDRKLRILIADDHEVLRRGIRTLLLRYRQWVICGETARAGDTVAEARRLKPDLIILDISLPDSDGLRIIPKLRAACKGAEIVVLTMHDSGHVICQVLAAGVRSVVLKCDAAHDLVTAIKASGNRQTFLSERAKAALQRMSDNTASFALDKLTSREREVLILIAEGRTNKEAAAALGLSTKTVNTHRSKLMSKLNLHTSTDLALFVIRSGIVRSSHTD